MKNLVKARNPLQSILLIAIIIFTASVPSQGHVSLMMQTTTILTYLNGFLK